LSVPPDVYYLAFDATVEEWSDKIDFMAEIPDIQRDYWGARYVDRPMPFNMHRAYAPGDQSSLFFWWDKSYVLFHKPFYYEFEISNKLRFYEKDIIVRSYIDQINWVSVATSLLEPHTVYYWRVIARNEHNSTYNFQYSTSITEDKEGIASFTTPMDIPEPEEASQIHITNTKTAKSGYTYATLDNVSPCEEEAGCMYSVHPVPHGWQIAHDNQQTKHDIKSLGVQWGTDSLVLANGARISPLTGLYQDGFGEGCNSLVEKVLSDNVKGYTVFCTKGNKRILLCK